MTYNLSELSSKVSEHQIKEVDAMTAKYLEEVIKHITQRGDKIEDYTLALVHNPMEVIDGGLKVTMQYKVMKISELQNIPRYGEE